ncbi:hypothetical protein KR067_004627 [Drosophila pandora]|nr:hypothetical protein KR067_004627 [Drosophila pandora]
MTVWSQVRPWEWCQEIYKDRYSWSFVKCALVFSAGVILIRSLDGKMPDPDLVTKM